jgi:predicted permease
MRRWLDLLHLRTRALFLGRRLDTDLRNEIEVHVQEQTDEYIAAGMRPNEARSAALRAFGPVAAIEEQCRDARRVSVVQNIAADLRYTLRSLRRQPLLVAAATLSIAVAIGANTAIFTVATELLLATPTTARPSELVHVRTRNGSHVSYLQWQDLARSGALAGLAGYQIEAEVNWRGPERSITVVPLIVTANFFDLLGVPVAMGRGFTADEAHAARQPRLAVISHGFWQKQLGGDPSAVGRTLVINGHPYTVLGVLPAKLRAFPGFGLAPDLYLPLNGDLMPDLDQRSAAAVQLVGRLHPGQTDSQAHAALSTVIQHIDAQNPDARLGGIAQLTRVGGSLLEIPRSAELGAFFLMLLVVVGLILGIACANVSGLLLARATGRRREIAVRVALGASRARLVQQLLTEGLWLATFGTASGLLLMFVLLRALASLSLPLPVPVELHAAFDRRFVLYVFALLTFTTLLCSLIPAWQATRSSIVPGLKQEEPRYAHRRWTLRGILVMGQVMIALVLLLTALLFVRNLTRARSVDPGFDVRRAVVAQVGFVEGRHNSETRVAFLEEAVARLETVPAVERASYARGVPLTLRSGMTIGVRMDIEGAAPTQVFYEANFVGPEYFSTMGIPVLNGREFSNGDRAGAPAVAIVNEEFARRYFNGRDPVGRHITLPAEPPYAARIVSVVANSKHRTLGEDQAAAVYEPLLQRGNHGRFVHVLARMRDGTPAPLADIERLLAELDPSAAIEVRTMRSTLAFAFLPSQVGAALLGSLGVLGLALAMVGLYAAISYAVSRRTGEIGIRMALGASRPQVLRLVIADAAIIAGVGIVVGLAVAAFITRPLAMFLVAGLSVTDPVTFGGAAALMGAVSLLAATIPARRAMRIDPAGALRAE